MTAFPLSDSLRAGEWLVVSGQLGFDGDELAVGVARQTRCALGNLRSVLESEGVGMSSVVKTTVFLTSMDDYEAMNVEYARAFDAPYPARSAVAVKDLPCGGLVEIEAWVHVGATPASHA